MLKKFWIELRSSLWFVPGVLVLIAIVMAMGLVELDTRFYESLRTGQWERLLASGADGARGMLQAIAASMITVAGVAFSVTIVTLSLASTQYTPRILRNFMRDRANQFVLGIFVAVFTYCLVVLRAIRSAADDGGGGFVPLLAVGFGMLLALLSIGCLIYFIHHIAASIQASTILKSITEETLAAMELLFPENLGDSTAEFAAEPSLQHVQWREVDANATGYLQNIDSDGLMRWAEKRDTLLRLECSPGDFVHEGALLVSSAIAVEDEAQNAIRAFFAIGDFRTVEQDTLFGIRQIVDIALKALSPGVNDTNTAVSCLDYLGAILYRLAHRRFDSPFRTQKGELRVIASTPIFAEFVAKGFDEIRHSAGGNVTILLQLQRIIGRIAAATSDRERRENLLTHARLAAELADRSIDTDYDRAKLNMGIAETRLALRATAFELPALRLMREEAQ